jgi:hypothetical protein
MIKKLVFFFLLSIVSVSCFSQQDTVTLPNGQKLIPKNPNSYPSAVYNDSLKVISHNVIVNGKRVNLQLRAGDIKDAAISATAAAIASKASTTDLSNLDLQLRSDLATKARVETINGYLGQEETARMQADDKFVKKTVTLSLITYTDMQNVALSSVYPSFQTNGSILDGTYRLIAVSPTSVTKRVVLTGLGASVADGSVTSQVLGNGTELDIKFLNGSPVSHEFYSNAWGGIRDSIRYNREMLGSKASSVDLSAEAAARVAGDAAKLDTSKIRMNGQIAIGAGSLKLSDNTRHPSIAIGDSTLGKQIKTHGNIAFGTHSLKELVTGEDNTSIGIYSMMNVVNAFSNVAIGKRSLQNLKNGVENTAIGTFSMISSERNNNDTYIGMLSGSSDSISQNSTGIGNRVLLNNAADYATAIGAEAAFNNSYGLRPIAIGYRAAYLNKIGNRNISIGYKSLFSNQTGSNNVTLGDSSSVFTTGSNNIIIGNSIEVPNPAGSNQLNIGGKIIIYENGEMSFTNRVIKNVNNAIHPNDAINKSQLDAETIARNNSVKSKTLTLTTTTPPTLDFESGIQVTYVLTTVQNGDFFSSPTISNLRDGATYRIRFKANNTGNVFIFPSNVYKKDGTAMGVYSVTSETLIFHVEGTDLYCDNK